MKEFEGSQMKQITSSQIKQFWTEGKKRGFCEADLYTVTRRFTGKISIKTLTHSEAKTLIAWLRADGDIRRVPLKSVPSLNHSLIIPVQLITPPQMNRILELMDSARWDHAHLIEFIAAKFKRNNILELKRKEAGVIIHMLEYYAAKKQETH